MVTIGMNMIVKAVGGANRLPRLLNFDHCRLIMQLDLLINNAIRFTD